jgi:hypothetical protein
MEAVGFEEGGEVDGEEVREVGGSIVLVC